jgi:DNA-binding NarL/FixJ family response regulator
MVIVGENTTEAVGKKRSGERDRDRIRFTFTAAPASSNISARLVFLTVHEDADYVRAALDAGGLGYVVKARLASDLLPAIRAALADRRFISPTVHLDETRLTSPHLPAKPIDFSQSKPSSQN